MHARLFRRAATRSVTHRFFGTVVAVLPPSAATSIAVAAISLLCLLTASVVVEMPMRAEAVGVLMPPGGFLDITAAEAGRVAAVHVREGDPVGNNQLLMEVAADALSLAGHAVPELQLQSLRAEMALLAQIHAQREALAESRMAGLQQEVTAVEERIRLGEQRLAGKKGELEVAEAAFRRKQSLAERGHLSRDERDRERSRLFALTGAVSEVRQQQASLSLERERLQVEIAGGRREARLNASEFALQQERLAREIGLAASRHLQGIRSPQSAVLIRLPVREGMSVQRGQVVARLASGSGPLEAWLYLSSASARMLEPGQQVELSLDAWPRSVFGARHAVVYAVSPVALLPREVAAPVNIAGPVFEVRATMADGAFSAYGSSWPVPPGSSFRASIIQKRLRLYQWLFRTLQTTVNDRRA